MAEQPLRRLLPPLTPAQAGMLARLRQFCRASATPAWVGDATALAEIGGRGLLYELEQAGVVSINRIGPQWVVVPSSD